MLHVLFFEVRGRYAHREKGPYTNERLNRDISAKGICQIFTNSQAQSNALLIKFSVPHYFCECCEKSLKSVIFYADTCINDFDIDKGLIL